MEIPDLPRTVLKHVAEDQAVALGVQGEIDLDTLDVLTEGLQPSRPGPLPWPPAVTTTLSSQSSCW